MKKLFSIFNISALLCISCISCSTEPKEYNPTLASITILDGKVILELEADEYAEISHGEFCKDVTIEAVEIYNHIADADIKINTDNHVNWDSLRIIGCSFEQLSQDLYTQKGERYKYKNKSEIIDLTFQDDYQSWEYSQYLYSDYETNSTGIPLTVTNYSDKSIHNELEIWLKAIKNVTQKYSTREDIEYPELMYNSIKDYASISFRAHEWELYPPIREVLRSVYRSNITDMLKFEAIDRCGGIPIKIFGFDKISTDFKEDKVNNCGILKLNVDNTNKKLTWYHSFYGADTIATYTDPEEFRFYTSDHYNIFSEHCDSIFLGLYRYNISNFYTIIHSENYTIRDLVNCYKNYDAESFKNVSLHFSEQTTYHHMLKTFFCLWHAGYVDPTPLIECKYPPQLEDEPIDNEAIVEVVQPEDIVFEENEVIYEAPFIDETSLPEYEEIAIQETVPFYIFADLAKTNLCPEDFWEYEEIIEKKEEDNSEINYEEVFTAVEQMPQFPGGEAELMNWISNHIKYPTMAMENNVQGQVVVQFVITKDGSIGDVKVVRSRDADLDKEAVRVVKSLPKFIPGKMNGQPVNVWYTLPVRFKLPEK